MVFNMVCFLEARPEAVEELKAKLLEVAVVYRNDKGTLDWSVQQDLVHPHRLCIVERYADEESERIHHQGNPIFQSTIDFIQARISKAYELHTWHDQK
ncbi:hypothetical protein I302_107931 [Kwoniella bestiolae CBS 10118]|uniref:ABM domain-containing protein n=1 Tax=Kwoniella bestiolae CBS 10118 TaxID=1296100 RepID=A0AAJ8KEQ5_9TREE